MANYKVRGPDGAEHELSGPDGATDEQIIAAAEEAFGQPRAETPMPAAVEADKQGLQDVSIGDTMAAPFMAADAVGEKTAEGLGKAGHPLAGAAVGTAVQMLPYAPAAAAGIEAAGALGDTAMSNVGNVRDRLSKWFATKAEEQAVKSASPTTVNFEQMGGPEMARKTGRYMLDKDIVTPWANSEEMLKKVEPLNKAAGKAIGEFRDKGDLRSLAQGAERPTSLQIEQAVRAKLAAKYGPGAEAGQGGQLDDAINEIRNLSPVNKSTTGAEMAQTMENVGGAEPQAYQAARASQEVLPEMTDGFPYLHDQPLFTELAEKATRLNEVAKGSRMLNQPSGALTDAANVLSHKSTEGLEGFLTAEERPAFGAAKEEFGMTEDLKSVMDRTQNRDLTANTNIPLSHTGRITSAINAVAPASVRATVADKIANALRTDPQVFGRNGQALQRAMQAGKASLNSTIYMLQQQDPEFKAKFEEMNNQ